MDISVFDRLSKTNSDNIIEVFFENLDYLFEYNKDEIIEYLKEEPCRLKIREKIYSELCKVVKSVDGKSLFQRRKSVYLAEDIYYLGFSFVHKQAHTKLKDVLRKYNIPSEQINVELKTNVPVTIQCNVVVPYFGRICVLIASLSNVKYSVMLWSDNRNILDYRIFVARYCFKYVF